MKRKITIIIGAGASVPFGMPTGQELRDLILRNSAPSDERIQAIRTAYSSSFDLNFWNESFIDDFKNANTISIDSFLAYQSDEVNLIGRICMTELLLKSERLAYENSKSSYSLVRKKFSSVDSYKEEINLYKDNWIQHLINFLNPKNGKYRDFLDRLSKIQFISFNYDRLLEQNLFDHFHYNYVGVKNSGKEEQMKNDFNEALSIKYVYGRLGHIELKNSNYIAENLPSLYKEKITGHELLNSASKLNLMRADEESSTVYDYLKKSEQIFILGFSFDEDNVKKINLLGGIDKPLLYVTSLGLDEQVKNILIGRFEKNKMRGLSQKTVCFFEGNSPSTDALRHLKILN